MKESTSFNGTWRLGSRRSELALWQTNHIRDLLLETWPECNVEIETFSTKGDQLIDKPLPSLGGKGLFTEELEKALLQGSIDAAVHSLKDLPVEPPAGTVVGAIPSRENPADVIVSHSRYTLESLPKGAVVGTSSRRRAAQLLCLRPDVQTADIRGNVPTRIRKALDPAGPYDAIILAYAGIKRLDQLEVVSQVLPLDAFFPAPGQGALAIQCRDETRSLTLLNPLNHFASQAAAEAERSFLSGLGGGCALPIAARAQIANGLLTIFGRVLSPDGSQLIDVKTQGSPTQAGQLGASMAQDALVKGAAELMELVQ